MTHRSAWRRFGQSGTIVLLVSALVGVSCRRDTDATDANSSAPTGPPAGKAVGEPGSLTQGSPAAAPAARQTPERRVVGDPKSLVVQAEDLPVRFAMSGGEAPRDGTYSHVYFNPEALLAEGGAEEKLLGVIVNLTLFDGATEADQGFTDQGGLDKAAVLANVSVATPGAVAKSAEPYAFTSEKAGRVVAFRVRYALQGTEVVEYRLRFRVANAVANLIISSRLTADGAEPPTFAARVRDIAGRQLQRLESARR